MKPRKIRDGVFWLGAVDWNRRLFDSLIPLPDGTSYNSYLVQGTERTALLDTVDPSMTGGLMANLEQFPRIDYIVSQHAEQDHSGAIPTLLEKYPEVRVICTPKATGMLVEHLGIPAGRLSPVSDGDELSLGGKTLKFIHTPWVHWPETMSTYLPEERILFTCDLFGSHYASTNPYAGDEPLVYEAAKRYYAEIMMPFRRIILNNLKKLEGCPADLIAPSHGPIHDDPPRIIEAYHRWASDKAENLVVVAYVSMHGSTEMMADHLVGALADREIMVRKFDLTVTDLGKVAISLVDAATLVIGTPTVNGGPHPNLVFLTSLVNSLRPKLKHWAMIGSYGWGSKVAEQLSNQFADFKIELLGSIFSKGLPTEKEIGALNELADAIQRKHQEMSIVG